MESAFFYSDSSSFFTNARRNDEDSLMKSSTFLTGHRVDWSEKAGQEEKWETVQRRGMGTELRVTRNAHKCEGLRIEPGNTKSIPLLKMNAEFLSPFPLSLPVRERISRARCDRCENISAPRFHGSRD